eukprot:8923918-Alexandrium_andersonii.AAC.1
MRCGRAELDAFARQLNGADASRSEDRALAAPVPPRNLIADRKRVAAALPTQQAGLASHAPVL